MLLRQRAALAADQPVGAQRCSTARLAFVPSVPGFLQNLPNSTRLPELLRTDDWGSCLPRYKWPQVLWGRGVLPIAHRAPIGLSGDGSPELPAVPVPHSQRGGN